LEGSAQKSGARVRVNAQLIDAATGAHLWADQFDANQGELLEMQDEIVTRLARALQIELATVEASRVARAHPENLDAENFGLQCEASYLRFGLSRIEMQPAYALCERALEIDDRNVRALVILALRLMVRVQFLQSADPQADLSKSDELVSRSLAIDSNNYLVRYARAYLLALQRRDGATDEAERALALNPSFLPTYLALWTANWMAGRPEKANEYADVALRLSPHDPLVFSFFREKGFGLFAQSHYEEATEAFKRSIAANPDYEISYMMLTASLALTGHEEEARETLRRYLALPVDKAKTIAEIKAHQPFDSPFLRDYYDRVYQGLLKAGLPEL
jgi:tetratricopeptide (TPR) repeat protein